MARPREVELLIVSLGSTEGLRRADRQLCEALERAGVATLIAAAERPRELPTFALTDLAWARAARVAAERELARLARPPRAIIYSSTTAALLSPRPGAIRFDAPAAGNRPGRHGLWQRPLERLRLAHAPLLLPWSEGAMREAPAAAARAPALVLPVAVEPSAPAAGQRDVAAVTYAANPHKKGLDRVLAAWRRAEVGDGELLVTGTSAAELFAAGIDLAAERRVRLCEGLDGEQYRSLVRRARLFVCAPRREDYGIAQLEALADGCQLVSTPAPGPYAALPLARQLDPRLVGEDLTAGLQAALSEPRADYAERALELLAPYRQASVDALIAAELLPRLLA